MPKQAPRLSSGGAKSNPGRVRTGISRAILLQLRQDKGLTVNDVLESLGPRSGGVTPGTIWTILERASLLGLVRSEVSEGRKRPRRYLLTDGGRRRVDWIRRRKSEISKTRIAANPGEEG